MMMMKLLTKGFPVLAMSTFPRLICFLFVAYSRFSSYFCFLTIFSIDPHVVSMVSGGYN